MRGRIEGFNVGLGDRFLESTESWDGLAGYTAV